MLSSNGSSSAEGCGGGAGYIGGNTWEVQYNLDDQSYSGAGGSSWGETTNGINYSTTSGGATEGGNGKAVITLLFQGSGTADDPYLISSVAAWNNLADQVNAGNTFYGKYFRLTKDISVTTMVGNSESNSFRGTFDGYGHTLTISYNTTSDYTAPFRYIQGATFKNLKVTGSITTTMNLAAGIAGLNTNAVATFEQCATDVTINSSSTTIVSPWSRYDYHGGLLARTNSVNVNITDCVCGGSVNGSSSSTSNCASFVGVAVSCTVTGTRCLSTTSYTNVYSWNPLCHAASAVRSVSVFYYVNGNDVCDGSTQVTTSQLADGSYATALQAGRPTTVWVQYLRTNQPMLKQFTKYTVTYHANGGSGSVPAAQDKQQGDDLMLSNSTLTRDGFTHTGWNTNSDGTGTHYDLGGTYSADADVTFYAEWSFSPNVAASVWQAISTPVHDAEQNYVSVSNVGNLTNDNYDLLRYNETAAKWENQKAGSEAVGFSTLDIGRGYIYRCDAPRTLTFTGLPNSEENVSITLTATDAAGDLKGFNLVGNPYPHTLPFYRAYYSLRPDGTWARHNDGGTLAIGEAVLVYTASGETLTLSSSGIVSGSKGTLPPLPQSLCLSSDCDDSSNDAITQSSNLPFARIDGDRLIIEGTGTLQAFDIMGRELFTQEISIFNFQFSISQFPHSGVYILRLDEKSQKIVISK